MIMSAVVTPVSYSILAVDDDAKILQIAETILEKEGYSVSLAGTGQEALRTLQNNKIDLVLLDVMLPDGDGYSLCRTIKNDEGTRDIPVILLTALDGIENKVRGLDVGACDYLVKPFLQRELLARIRSHLREREFTNEMKSLYAIEKRRTRELGILHKLTTEFNRLLDLHELLNHAAEVISTELNFHGCLIGVPDGVNAQLRFEASYHPSIGRNSQDPPSPAASEGIVKWVAFHQKAMIVPDVEKDPGSSCYFRDTQCQMAVPLIHQGQVVGVVAVESPCPNAYTTDDLNLLSTVAGSLALALKNAELYSEVKLNSEKLKTMVEQRTLELQNQKRFMECIVDSLPIGIYVLDTDFTVVTWNKKRETGILGISRDQVIGKKIFSVFSKMGQQKLKGEFDHVFSTGNPFETETVSWSSGEKRHYHLRKIPMSLEGDRVTHVITLGEDISDRKRMEESLLTNEKLASIGKLAAGIAHEINNPLAAIAGCVEGLISRSDDRELSQVRAFEDFPEYLKIIEDEIGRCKGIIRNLLDFNRSKEILQQEINVNETLEQTLQLLKHHKGFKQMRVIQELNPACPTVVGNSGELRQVFLAMAINAMDAMNESGTLTIKTDKETRNGQSFVCVQFQDSGIGIAAKNLNKIFDPFFTTKPVGKGTGLGLSICYGIIRSHDGFIKVKSEESKGSLFEIYIPAKPARGVGVIDD
jgi:two-component system, NtrC family, sensor kinase